MTKFFKDSEFTCSCCGKSNMNNELLFKLDNARHMARTPFVITSAYRCESHNKKVGGLSNSAHLTGHAVDIACSDSSQRLTIVSALLEAGFARIGVYKSFIHADVDGTKPMPAMWVK